MLKLEKLTFWFTLVTFAFPLAMNFDNGYRLHLFELPLWLLYFFWAFRFGLRLERLRLFKFDFYFALFMGWLALSLTLNDAWDIGAKHWLFWFKCYLIGVYLRHNLYRLYSLASIVTFLIAVLFFEVSLGIFQGITQSSIGVVQQYFGQKMEHMSVYNTGAMHVVRVQGTFKHCNILGNWIVMLAPLAIAKALTTARRIRRVYWLCAIASIIALVLTLSRGNWGAMAFGLFMMAYLTDIRQHSKLRFGKTVGAVGIVIFIGTLLFVSFDNEFSIFTEALSQRVEKLPGSRSSTTRYNLVLASLQLIEENLFLGVGLGSSNDLLHYTDYEIRERFSSTVHNIFLIIATEGGIIALILFFIAFWEPFKNLLRMARLKNERATKDDLVIAAGLLGGYSGLAFAMLWYVGMLDQSELPLILTFANLGLGLRPSASAKEVPESLPGHESRNGVIPLAVQPERRIPVST